MTRSQLFSKAHQMTRRALRPGDDYRVTFGAALRHLYALERANALAAKVNQVGVARDGQWSCGIRAKVWARNGRVRVYVNTTHRRPAGLGYFDVLRGAFRADCSNGCADSIRAIAA